MGFPQAGLLGLGPRGEQGRRCADEEVSYDAWNEEAFDEMDEDDFASASDVEDEDVAEALAETSVCLKSDWEHSQTFHSIEQRCRCDFWYQPKELTRLRVVTENR